MNMLFAYSLLALTVVYAFVTSKYVLGAALAFIVITVETVINIPRDSFGTFFTLSGMVAITVLVIMDGRKLANDSVLIRFNPFCKKNVLPKKLQIIICAIFSLALLTRVIVFSRPAKDINHGRIEDQYWKEANAFINKIVVSHKKGEDYRSVAKSNPFTNDVFVCKVVALLESECGRIAAMSHSISTAMKYDEAQRKEKLRNLSDECIKESSNVVQRISGAGIGKMNVPKMANDFSEQYIRLGRMCHKAVEGTENGR